MNIKAIELINQALELLAPKEAKPTIIEIIHNGQDRIHNAVEAVIAKHEKDIEESSKVSRETGFDGFVKNENARRMAALQNDHDRYLDQLIMTQNSTMGVGFGASLAGFQGASSLNG